MFVGSAFQFVLLIVKSFLFPEICNFEFMLQHGKPTMNWFLPSDRCDRWIKDCFLSAPYMDWSLNPKVKCLRNSLEFYLQVSLNSVAPIAPNRVYVREICFNCSNFICKERSLFFRFCLFCFFCCCCCFSINYNYFPLACFPLFSLLTLYVSRDYSDYVFLIINIYRLFRNSLVIFRFF